MNAIAPPMSTVSQRSSSASITPSLSLDLGAAEHRDERAGHVVGEELREHLDLAVQQATARVRQDRGGPTIDACARCDAPNASFT